MATAVEKFVKVFERSPQGRAALEAVQAEEAILEERRAMATQYDQAQKIHKRIPGLRDELAKAEKRHDDGVRKLAEEFLAVRSKVENAVREADRLQRPAEGTLRRTAHPLVHDSGPIAKVIAEAVAHLRTHMLGTEEDRARQRAKLTPRSDAREDREPIENARAEVRRHDEALDRLEAFLFASDELRDMQLEVEPDPAAVREVLDALPTKCIQGCGESFTFQAALTEALEPKEIIR